MPGKLIFRGIIVLVVLLFLASCTPYFYQPFGKKEAMLGPETEMKKELLNLPEPKEPIVVAVYKFRDQTGQYKASSVGASWSTAVTQGATNILIRALEESGWFVPIERENISNLLNERKIIRSSREQYEGNSNIMLPPLLFAGVLLEGGIVSYETNIFTGGAGIRYFGTDASAQYREDRVSIYLRAVSTSNGKILKTIYTTKSILSQEVSTGVFRYVKFKRLLEAETGYTYNEPTEMAITEAVEKAVYSLIIEGILDNLWLLKNEADFSSAPIQNYRKEKEENINLDSFGRKFDQKYRSKVYGNFGGTGQWYLGDYSSGQIKPGFISHFGAKIIPSIYLEGGFGIQQTHLKNLMISTEYLSEVNALFLANPNGKFSPFLTLGSGCYFDSGKPVGKSNKDWIPYISYGAGLELLLSGKLAINSKGFVNQMLSDYFDNSKSGNYNDYIFGFQFGLKIYIGN